METKKYIKTIFVIIGMFFLLTGNSQEEIFKKRQINSKEVLELKKIENEEFVKVQKLYELFFRNNKREEAFKLSRKLLKTLKTDASKSYLVCLQSSYYSEKKKSDSTIYYAKKALEYENFSSDSLKRKRKITGSINLGNGYWTKGLYQKAKKVYITTLENAEKWGFKKEYYGLTFNLGNMYLVEEKYEKAIKYYKISVNSPDLDIKSGSLSSMGNVYGELKDYSKSNEYYFKSLQVNNKNLYFNLATRLNIVDNNKFLGKQNEMIPELKRIINEAKENGLTHHEKFGKNKLAEAYEDEGKLNLAKGIFLDLLGQEKKEGNMGAIVNQYSSLKELAKKQKNYKSALSYSEEYIKMKDSINLLQKAEEINALEVKYETLQKEKEIIVLKKDQQIKKNEIEKQTSIRNIILVASGLIIVTILLLLLFYFQKLKTQKLLNKTQKEINYQRIKALMKEQELELIKASIEGQDNERKRLAKGLHDSIGSSMAAIKMQLEKVPSSSNKLEKIKDNLNDTYEQVRELSHNLLPKKIRQNDYAVLLNEYLKKINEITDVKISFNISQEETINKIDKFLQNEIFAIIQELITNTIKHAEAKKIDINLEVIKDNIHLSFEDNGKGFDTKLMSKGIGLKNIKNRVAQLSGSYIIDSHPKRGTLFKMEMLVEIYPVEEVV